MFLACHDSFLTDRAFSKICDINVSPVYLTHSSMGTEQPIKFRFTYWFIYIKLPFKLNWQKKFKFINFMVEFYYSFSSSRLVYKFTAVLNFSARNFFFQLSKPPRPRNKNKKIQQKKSKTRIKTSKKCIVLCEPTLVITVLVHFSCRWIVENCMLSCTMLHTIKVNWQSSVRKA